MILRFKTVIITLICFLFGMAVLMFSPFVRRGIANGIDVCITTVIPSLFLFSCVSCFAVKSGICYNIGKAFDKFSKPLFNLSGEEFAVFLFSCVSGYPVGASLVTELYKSGRISQNKAVLMTNFCVAAGPAFILVAVGEISLGSRSDGQRLLAAHVISSVLLAIIFGVYSRFSKTDTDKSIGLKPFSLTPQSTTALFVDSVTEASKNIFKICGFIVAFGGIGGMVSADNLPVSPFFANLVRALLEVTVGIDLFGRGRLALLAFLLGFGGISVHFQVLSVTRALKIKYFPFVCTRLVHGVCSAFVIAAFEKILPRSIDTLAQSNTSPEINGSPFSVAALLLMGITLIVYSKRQRRISAK